MPALSSTKPSFYALAPDLAEADDLWASYLGFLEQRNGALSGGLGALSGTLPEAGGFERREQQLDELDSRIAEFSGHIDPDVFNRNYERYQDKDLSEETLVLLAFVKMNAGEAYGVEVMAKARAHLMRRAEPVYVLERILSREETYHTRILVGAAAHFRGIEATGAWRPAWPLKLLMLALANFPPCLFHPVLIGAEISGVFTLNWMLERLSSLFPNDPGVRESMEQRLIEVLIDEVGHVAYNRICVGPLGLRAAKPLAAGVSQSHDQMTPELIALGYAEHRKQLDDFDFMSLPAEVRERAWFV